MSFAFKGKIGDVEYWTGMESDDTGLPAAVPGIHNGSDGRDHIEGLGGNDSINAGNSNDTILAGAGDDTISGGIGDDLIEGGLGNDSIDAGSSADVIDAGVGDDTVDAGSGIDWIQAGTGNDIITGGTGPDTYVFRLTLTKTGGGGSASFFDEEFREMFGGAAVPEQLSGANTNGVWNSWLSKVTAWRAYMEDLHGAPDTDQSATGEATYSFGKGNPKNATLHTRTVEWDTAFSWGTEPAYSIMGEGTDLVRDFNVRNDRMRLELELEGLTLADFGDSEATLWQFLLDQGLATLTTGSDLGAGDTRNDTRIAFADGSSVTLQDVTADLRALGSYFELAIIG